MTFNEHGDAMLEIAREAQAEIFDAQRIERGGGESPKPFSSTPADRGPEARDLALSITHLEDALTRYNSSRYRRKGTWGRADPDATPP